MDRFREVEKRVAILQSSYIPWKGYFDIINMVDEFVLFDDVQFTRRDWRTRNLIKTEGNGLWLSVPVQSKGNYLALIQDVRILQDGWHRKHWASLQHAYARAPFFKHYKAIFEDLYNQCASLELLSHVNLLFIRKICEILEIQTKITWSSDYPASEGKNNRLLSICRAAGATTYLSGPSARCYLDEGLFGESGVRVEFMDYSGYPVYPQLHGEFRHDVSILDLLFNVGPEAKSYMKSFSNKPREPYAEGVTASVLPAITPIG